MGDRWQLFQFCYERKLADPKLVNPLPQTHPLEVCTIIFNRDFNSNPVNIAFGDIVK